MSSVLNEPQVGYPAALASYAGRMNDVDAHEWIPPELWVERFGELTRPFAELDLHSLKGMKNNYFRDVDSDKVDTISFRSAWFCKSLFTS